MSREIAATNEPPWSASTSWESWTDSSVIAAIVPPGGAHQPASKSWTGLVGRPGGRVERSQDTRRCLPAQRHVSHLYTVRIRTLKGQGRLSREIHPLREDPMNAPPTAEAVSPAREK